MGKTCFVCGTYKEITEFYPHVKMKDGHLNKCRVCTKEYERSRRQGEFREKILKYDRERASLPHRKEKTKLIVSAWKVSHPKRRAAQVALGNAVRSKKIIPLPCLICGEKAEAHHPDYDRPLDVVWLCPSHHKQTHALSRKLMEESTW